MNEAVPAAALATLTYREACRQALREALQADPRCILLGEDVGLYGGCYAVSKGLLEEFGPERVVDTPLAEAAITGIAIGAATRSSTTRPPSRTCRAASSRCRS